MNSQSSITYCDEYDSSDGFIEGTYTKSLEEKNVLKSKFLSVRQSLFSPVEESKSKTSQPKMLSPEYQFEKENLPPMVENENGSVESVWELPVESKPRRKKPLRDLGVSSQAQSQIQQEPTEEKQPGSANRKGTRKSKKLWQGCIFDDNLVSGTNVEKKVGATRKSFPGKESASPEYEQDPKMKFKSRRTIHDTTVSPTREEISTESGFLNGKGCVTSGGDGTELGFSPRAESDREDEKTWDKMSEHLIPMFPNEDPKSPKLERKRTKSSLEITAGSVPCGVEKNQVTTKGEDVKHLEMESIHSYTKDFSVEKFVKNIPDPWSYFGDRSRLCESYSDHSLHYLKMKFRKHYAQTINDALMFHNYNLFLAYKYLMKKNRGVKLRSANRPLSECNANRPTTINEQFEQEVAFIENEAEVRNYLKNQKALRKQRLKEAVRQGTLKECECCLGAEFLPEEIVGCTEGHTFCRECVVKHVEMEVKNGRCEFDCLSHCNRKYSTEVIKDILNPELFSKISEISKLVDMNDAAVRDSV